MCYINARSVINKTIFLNDFIYTHNFDLFAISETWLGCEATNDIHINSILPDGYMMTMLIKIVNAGVEASH